MLPLFISIIMLTISAFAQESDIRDIKPPLASGFNYWIYLFLLIILILLALLVWYLIKKRRQTKAVPLAPRAAHEIALERLSNLKGKRLVQKGLIKEFYIELSDIVRRYVEARFSFRAPEMTTQEFLSSLKYSSILSGSEKELLEEFLTRCDLVKFAKYSPSVDEIEQSFKSAEEFIVGTKQEIIIQRENIKR